MAHDIGDLVTLRVRFTDADGNAVDPSTVLCSVEPPTGALMTPTPANPEEGVYEAQVTPDEAGVWRYRFEGGGSWVAAEEGSFEVQASDIGAASPAMTEIRFRLRIRGLTAANYDPALDDEDIDDLVDLARRPDGFGLAYGDEGWEPTYDLNAAVASGWETKAARAAGDFRFEEDNQAFYREQVFNACQAQAKRWNRRCIPVERI